MAEPTEALTVSRADAQKYEKYEKWYKNEEGLFGKLGKYLVKSATSAVLTRLDMAGMVVSPTSSVENLRNVVPRIVEFYATTMLSGKSLDEALPLHTDADKAQGQAQGDSQSDDNDPLKAAILKVWEWSNLFQSIRVAKRYLARDGQMFEKVARPEGKDFCYLQFIPAKNVTDFSADERGNIIYIRLDVPDTKVEESGLSRKIWRTEIWRKEKEGQEGYALFAEVERTSEASVPTEKRVEKAPGAVKLPLGSEAQGAYRFDFVPFVVVNAQDTGEKRPDPVYAHGLHLIAWICREATRLSDLMFRFNKAFKVVFGMGNDAQGRPMPAPRIAPRDLGAAQTEQVAADSVPFADSRASLLSRDQNDISIEGIAVTGLPGSAQMADATPNINYEAARQWISDHMREAYETLPELLYYSVESRANQSGVALRTLIAGAINRGEEMQANIIAGLVKADKMALTIAQLEGFEGFSEAEIGTYNDGEGFQHEIEPPEIMPLSDLEDEDVRAKKIANAQKLVDLGVTTEAAMKEVGLDVEVLTLRPEPVLEPLAEPSLEPVPGSQSKLGGAALVANGSGNR